MYQKILRQVADEFNLPLEHVKIIMHDQWVQVVRALKDRNNRSVEISGLGTFKVSKTRVLRQINHYKAQLEQLKEEKSKYSDENAYYYKLRKYKLLIEHLNKVYDEFSTCSRRHKE